MTDEATAVLEYVDEVLRLQPVLMLFLVIGLGYLLGNIRIRNFSFGPVAGVLFAGLFLGYFGFRITPAAQAVGFAMFIFSVGYQAGPQFFHVLKQDGLKYFTLAVVVAVTGFAIAAGWSAMMGLEPGTSAGLLAGGLTSSPTLAAAQDAVQSGTVPVPEGWTRDAVINNIATGYAITYIFGLAGLITVIKLLPGLLGIDLVQEAERMTREAQAGKSSGPVNVSARCYRVENEEFTQLPVREIRERYWDQITVTRIIRDGKRIELADDEHPQYGDLLELIGPRSFFTEVAQRIGEEVPLDWDIEGAVESAQVIVMNKVAVGRRLEELELARRFGLMLLNVRRMGVETPMSPDSQLEKGDTLQVVGPAANVNALGDYLGQVERDLAETDMVTWALGIAAGVVVGMLAVTVGGVSIGLGSAGGLLLSGLLIGYLRSIRPTFGRLPDAARWILMEFGLLVFMTGVGLRAGGGIIDTLLAAGPLLVVGGILVTLVPVLLGYLFGRKVLRIEPVLLFGAITGAMTSGASLGVVTAAARSPVPALGYTGTYAFSNVLLMIAGSLILLL